MDEGAIVVVYWLSCLIYDLAMLGTNIELMHLGFALDLFPTYIFHSFLTSLSLHSIAEQK